MLVARVIPVRRMPTRLTYLDYAVPENLVTVLKIGQLITVPFRSTDTFAIVESLHEHTTIDTKKIKEISSLIDPRPLVPTPTLNFITNIAELYGSSLGLLLRSILPPLQKRKLALLGKTEKANTSSEDTTSKKSPPPRTILVTTPAELASQLESLLASEDTTLILAPTKAVLEDTYKKLSTLVQEKIVLITSETSIPKLFTAWKSLWTGEKKIFFGTRRALFLPFERLEQIIICDEGNPHYKSWDMAPRYLTRDAVRLLAREYGSAITLITHTPSVTAAYHHVPTLPSPYETVTIINSKEERQKKNFNLLAEETQELLEKNITGISFLYLNRRGSVNYVACKDCALVATCPRCQSNLSYHESRKLLVCHQCEFTKPLDVYCTRCKGTMLSMYGGGTELLERQVKTALGGATGRRILRRDSDTAKGAYEPVPGDIVIGTQAAWADIPWELISLMVFVSADTSLFVPEYSVTEELWQQLNAARFYLQNTGSLIVQTAHPEHYVFQALQNPTIFYDHELKARKLFTYPPFCTLLKLFAPAATHNQSVTNGTHMYRWLNELTKTTTNITILPNRDAFPAYYRGSYWQIILVKITAPSPFEVIKKITTNLPTGWKIDINPNTLFSL